MESIEEKKLYEFINMHGIGNYSPAKNSKEVYLEFSENEFKWLISQRLVKDATFGGLVKGLTNNWNGAIYLLWPAPNGKLVYTGFVYPGWYISGPDSLKKNPDAFKRLESSVDNFLNYKVSDFKIPENCKILNTGNKEIAFLLLNSEEQFVFSKVTVLNHIYEIVESDNQLK